MKRASPWSATGVASGHLVDQRYLVDQHQTGYID